METDLQGDAKLPPHLNTLKWLVTVLTVVMIVGFLTLIATLVIRLNAGPALRLPDSISLPAGTSAVAFTQGPDWFAVVTSDNRILIFDATSGALRQAVDVLPAQ